MSTFDHLTRENVAAINRSKLESLREKVNLAEAGLRNARDQYEAEIERQGKPTAGIFADTVFVRRASSDRWLAEAENEFNAREAQNFAHVNEALRIIAAKKAIDDENDTEDENPYPDQEDDDDGGDDQSPDRPRDKSKKKGQEAGQGRRRAERG